MWNQAFKVSYFAPKTGREVYKTNGKSHFRVFGNLSRARGIFERKKKGILHLNHTHTHTQIETTTNFFIRPRFVP